MSTQVTASQEKSGKPLASAPEKISQRFLTGEKKYNEAIRMYTTSNKSLKEVAEICDVKVKGLINHIKRYYKTLFFERYDISPKDFYGEKIYPQIQNGQWISTHEKYRKAIEACNDIAYIEFNIYQIGRLFKLNCNALAAQLKVYYPEIISERERIRKKIGIASRGPRPGIADTYSEALDIYCDSDLSIPQVAQICNVSKSGFSRFMKCYHNDIVEAKESQRLANRKGRRKSSAASSANAQTTIPSHRILGL